MGILGGLNFIWYDFLFGGWMRRSVMRRINKELSILNFIYVVSLDFFCFNSLLSLNDEKFLFSNYFVIEYVFFY